MKSRPWRYRPALGWIKTAGGSRKAHHRGLERAGWALALTAAAYTGPTACRTGYRRTLANCRPA
jgi:hypothetical protein